MFGRLLLLFTLLPLLELVLLAWIGAKTSWWLAIGLVIGTGLAGAWLIRLQGWQTLRRMRADVAAGRVPTESLFDGLLVLLAGVLLITPGVITDLLAILLLLPPTRRLIQHVLRARLQARMVSGLGGFRQPGAPAHDQIIDVRVIDAPSRPSA